MDNEVREAIRGFPSGLTSSELSARLPGLPQRELVDILNNLLSREVIELFRGDDSDAVKYRCVEFNDNPASLRGLTTEEILLYQLIKGSGNKGIWTRHLRVQSGLHQAQMAKHLKILEARKLVKSVMSVEAKTRKLYMCYDTKPSRELTGGPWYSPGFDTALVNRTMEKALGRIRELGRASINDVSMILPELECCDVEAILNVLVYSGKCEIYGQFFQEASPVIKTTALTAVPCGVCPLLGEKCGGSEGPRPEKCPHLSKWFYSGTLPDSSPT